MYQNIDRRYLPGNIHPSDAFRRTTSRLERSLEVKVGEQRVRTTP